MKKVFTILFFSLSIIAEQKKVSGTVTSHRKGSGGYMLVEDGYGHYYDLGKSLPPMVHDGDHGIFVIDVQYDAPTIAMIGPKATIRRVMVDIPASEYFQE